VTRQEQAALLAEALGWLKLQHRQVIEFRHWDGLSFKEVALRMQRSPDAACKLWYRALKRLAEEFEREDESR